MKNKSYIEKTKYLVILGVVSLIVVGITNIVSAGDLNDREKENVKSVINLLNDMGMKDRADNIKEWFDTGNIFSADLDSLKGKTTYDLLGKILGKNKNNIYVDKRYIDPHVTRRFESIEKTPIPDEMKFDMLMELAAILVHEKVHAHQSIWAFTLIGGILGYNPEIEAYATENIFLNDVKRLIENREKIFENLTSEQRERRLRTVNNLIREKEDMEKQEVGNLSRKYNEKIAPYSRGKPFDLGTNCVNVNITFERGGYIVYGLQTEEGRIIDVNIKKGCDNPTLEWTIPEMVLYKSLYAKDPFEEYSAAYERGNITLRRVERFPIFHISLIALMILSLILFVAGYKTKNNLFYGAGAIILGAGILLYLFLPAPTPELPPIPIDPTQPEPIILPPSQEIDLLLTNADENKRRNISAEKLALMRALDISLKHNLSEKTEIIETKLSDTTRREATFHRRQGNYKDAIKSVDESITYNPNNPWAYVEGIINSEELGNHSGAVDYTKKLDEIELTRETLTNNFPVDNQTIGEYKDYAVTFNNNGTSIAKIAETLDDLDDAINAVKTGIEYMEKAMIISKTLDLAGVKDTPTKIVINNLGSANINLIVFATRAGDAHIGEEAISETDKLIARNPEVFSNDTIVKFNLNAGVFKAVVGKDYATGITFGMKALAIMPNSSGANNLVGACLAIQGGEKNVKAAKPYIQTAVKLEPTNEVYQHNLKVINDAITNRVYEGININFGVGTGRTVDYTRNNTEVKSSEEKIPAKKLKIKVVFPTSYPKVRIKVNGEIYEEEIVPPRTQEAFNRKLKLVTDAILSEIEKQIEDKAKVVGKDFAGAEIQIFVQDKQGFVDMYTNDNKGIYGEEKAKQNAEAEYDKESQRALTYTNTQMNKSPKPLIKIVFFADKFAGLTNPAMLDLIVHEFVHAKAFILWREGLIKGNHPLMSCDSEGFKTEEKKLRALVKE